MKTRKGVVRRRTLKERSGGGAGGRSPSFPQTRAAPSSRPAGRECEDKAAQTNLGARSHSGNSPEADAEGWIAFANGRQPQSGENRPETIKNFVLNGSLQHEPTAQMGRSEPFPPQSCRSQPAAGRERQDWGGRRPRRRAPRLCEGRVIIGLGVGRNRF
ncbi:MAG: hypothetical protein Q7S34_01510 [bacterium]|nr:hypothetical protein [bacterium]